MERRYPDPIGRVEDVVFKLGESKVKDEVKDGDDTLNINMKVKVRRQDSSTHTNVFMMDEFINFVKNSFPNYNSEFLKFPESFHYDKNPSKSTQGFPSKVKDRPDIPDYNWKTSVHGNSAEEEVYNALEKIFKSRTPSLMIHSLEVNNLS